MTFFSYLHFNAVAMKETKTVWGDGWNIFLRKWKTIQLNIWLRSLCLLAALKTESTAWLTFLTKKSPKKRGLVIRAIDMVFVHSCTHLYTEPSTVIYNKSDALYKFIQLLKSKFIKKNKLSLLYKWRTNRRFTLAVLRLFHSESRINSPTRFGLITRQNFDLSCIKIITPTNMFCYILTAEWNKPAVSLGSTRYAAALDRHLSSVPKVPENRGIDLHTGREERLRGTVCLLTADTFWICEKFLPYLLHW